MISQEQVRELLDYRDGALYWRKKIASKIIVGTRAGYHCTGAGTRRSIRLYSRTYYEHRIIWLWHYGEVPQFLDHVNTDPADNRIENLRGCSQSQNNANTHTSCSAGLKGVYFHHGGWRAKINAGGKTHYLGSYASPELASDAYMVAATRHFGEFARRA